MAPRRTKQTTAEGTAVAANDNMTPPKKRTLASSVTEGSQRPKALLRRRKAAKHEENAVADEFASPPKRSRLRPRNTTTKENVETEATPLQVIGRPRGRPAAGKKAETKKPTAAAKVKSQIAEKTSMKKQGNKVAIKDDVENKETGRSAPVKRSRRLNKPAEESQQPIVAAQIITKTLRRRKIVESVEAVTKEELVTNNNTRGRAKKTKADVDNAPKVKSKERSKKDSTKSDTKVLPKKSGTAKQRNIETTVATEKKSKVKDSNAKDSKKPVSRIKHNSRVKKIDSAKTEEVAIPKANIEDNGNAVAEKTTQTEYEQQEGNTGSGANNGNLEIETDEEEEQEVSIRNEEIENLLNEDETEDMSNSLLHNLEQQFNESLTEDVSSTINNNSLQEAEEAESEDEANGGNAELIEEDVKPTINILRKSIYETD